MPGDPRGSPPAPWAGGAQKLYRWSISLAIVFSTETFLRLWRVDSRRAGLLSAGVAPRPRLSALSGALLTVPGVAVPSDHVRNVMPLLPRARSRGHVERADNRLTGTRLAPLLGEVPEVAPMNTRSGLDPVASLSSGTSSARSRSATSPH